MGTMLSEAMERLRGHKTIMAWRWQGMEKYDLTEFRANWILQALPSPHSELMRSTPMWNDQLHTYVCVLTKQVKDVLEEISRLYEANTADYRRTGMVAAASGSVKASRMLLEERAFKMKNFRMKRIYLLSASLYMEKVNLKGWGFIFTRQPASYSTMAKLMC